MGYTRADRKYVGIYADQYGGMTDTGKIIRDAWEFELIPETCEGWIPQDVEILWVKVNKEWEKYGFLVSNLPDDLRERFMHIQGESVERARLAGWDPDLSNEG